MRFFRFASRLAAAFAGVVVMMLLVGAPRTAYAQTLSIQELGITRNVAYRTDVNTRFWVSYSDCILDDEIMFPLVVGMYGGSTLEVWATQSTSDDCRTDTNRTSASATCWRVYSATPTTTTPIVSIPVQDFVARPLIGTDGIGRGTAKSCESTANTGQPLTLWFMFLMGTSQVGTAQAWKTTVDLLGPDAPVVDSVGAGGGLIKVTWLQNTDPDVSSYRVFCEDMGSTTGGVITYEAGSSGPEGGGANCPDAGGGQTDDAGDGGDEDAGDEGGSAVADACTPGGGVSPPPTTCGSLLVAGTMLTPELSAQLECGGFSGPTATTATITGLTNGRKYAVAVASSDLVLNVGALSTVQCETPRPVNGFDEVYTSAGGTAGGSSFCSLGLRSAAARDKLWPFASFAAVVALALQRWRRRHPRPCLDA